jgi:hypothetical protein
MLPAMPEALWGKRRFASGMVYLRYGASAA